jgi:hypothetical protein
MENKIYIGIDPGTSTGLAVICAGNYHIIRTAGIIEAMNMVLYYKNNFPDIYGPVSVYCENPYKRIWYGDTGRERLQGAGSVKRDFAIWQEFCNYNNLEFTGVAPREIGCEFDRLAVFTAATGWTQRTSQHARDAAKIIYRFFNNNGKIPKPGPGI